MKKRKVLCCLVGMLMFSTFAGCAKENTSIVAETEEESEASEETAKPIATATEKASFSAAPSPSPVGKAAPEGLLEKGGVKEFEGRHYAVWRIPGDAVNYIQLYDKENNLVDTLERVGSGVVDVAEKDGYIEIAASGGNGGGAQEFYDIDAQTLSPAFVGASDYNLEANLIVISAYNEEKDCISIRIAPIFPDKMPDFTEKVIHRKFDEEQYANDFAVIIGVNFLNYGEVSLRYASHAHSYAQGVLYEAERETVVLEELRPQRPFEAKLLTEESPSPEEKIGKDTRYTVLGGFRYDLDPDFPIIEVDDEEHGSVYPCGLYGLVDRKNINRPAYLNVWKAGPEIESAYAKMGKEIRVYKDEKFFAKGELVEQSEYKQWAQKYAKYEYMDRDDIPDDVPSSPGRWAIKLDLNGKEMEEGRYTIIGGNWNATPQPITQIDATGSMSFMDESGLGEVIVKLQGVKGDFLDMAILSGDSEFTIPITIGNADDLTKTLLYDVDGDGQYEIIDHGEWPGGSSLDVFKLGRSVADPIFYNYEH